MVKKIFISFIMITLTVYSAIADENYLCYGASRQLGDEIANFNDIKKKSNEIYEINKTGRFITLSRRFSNTDKRPSFEKKILSLPILFEDDPSSRGHFLFFGTKWIKNDFLTIYLSEQKDKEGNLYYLGHLGFLNEKINLDSINDIQCQKL